MTTRTTTIYENDGRERRQDVRRGLACEHPRGEADGVRPRVDLPSFSQLLLLVLLVLLELLLLRAVSGHAGERTERAVARARSRDEVRSRAAV